MRINVSTKNDAIKNFAQLAPGDVFRPLKSTDYFMKVKEEHGRRFAASLPAGIACAFRDYDKVVFLNATLAVIDDSKAYELEETE